MQTIPISVVILCKNEERTIGNVLKSIAQLSDDIIIIDSGSTDKSERFCSSFANVQFIQTDWKGFGATKNFGNTFAKYDYILSLDADEVLSEGLQFELMQLGQSQLNGVYQFKRKTNYCGKWIHHGGWYPDAKIRLFPKRECSWTLDAVHETLQVPSDTTITQLNHDILHYSIHSKEEHIARTKTYAKLRAKMWREHKKNITFLKVLASAIALFMKSFFFKLGVLDGKAGFDIACISAQSRIWALKYYRNAK